MKTKRDYMTKSEFCQKTHISPDSWLFRYEKEHPIIFYQETYNGETVYHTIQGVEHRRFKIMPQYGEVWMALDLPNCRGLYSTWTTY